VRRRNNDFTRIDKIDITNSGENTLTLNQQEVLNMSDVSDTLYVISDSDDTVNIGTGWTLAETTIENGIFYRVLEQGTARLLLKGPRDWQNPAQPEDVNGVNGVSPLDVLTIIHQINSNPGDTSLPDPLVTPEPLFFYDVNGDGLCTPLDVLTVIQHINSRMGVSGEEESAQSALVAVADGPVPAFATPDVGLSQVAATSIESASLLTSNAWPGDDERVMSVVRSDEDTLRALFRRDGGIRTAASRSLWNDRALEQLDDIFEQWGDISQSIADELARL